jgi:hypothetical protein
MQPVIVSDDARLLQTRLQRFMNWLLAAFLTLGVLMTVWELRTPQLNGLLGTASVYGVLAALLVARFALLARPVAAITTISTGFWLMRR